MSLMTMVSNVMGASSSKVRFCILYFFVFFRRVLVIVE